VSYLERSVTAALHHRSLADVRRTVAYQSIRRGAYDPTTGGYASTVEAFNVAAIESSFTQEELTPDIAPTDKRLRITRANWIDAVAGVGGSALEPLADDVVSIGGSSYVVVAIRMDPSGSSWALQVRRG
jgi:hypothetical protein